MNLDTAIDYVTANKQTDLVNERGADTVAEDNTAQLQKSEFFSKLKPKQIVVSGGDMDLVEEEKIGGAFYLPVKKDVPSTWTAVLEALQSLPDCDVNLEEQEQFNAYGLQYFHDTFMLARTRLCKLEGEEGNFLEIHKLQGDGFVFADHFKKNLTEQIGEFVEDVDSVAPVQSENVKNPSLNYLDLSDETSATDMIQHWLQTLKPKGGVKYDHMQIYETLSCLGWNVNEEANFKALVDYSDYIVAPILEILRHEDTNHVPTAYFGAMCINKFVEEDAVPEAAKTWNSVFMLVEAMEKFCLQERREKAKNVAEMQVTRSREVLRLLISILEKFVPTVKGELNEQLPAKVGSVLEALAETLQKETIDSLRSTLLPEAEEEVQAA